MPYIIRPPRLRSTVAACAAALMVGAVPAQAATSPAKDTSQCVQPVLTQPLQWAADSNYYFLAPA